MAGGEMSLGMLFAHAGHAHTNLEDAMLTQEQAMALLLLIMAATAILSFIIYIIVALSLGKIFKKVGVKSWKAWVPIYNLWTLLELGGQKGYWSILALIPGINLITAIFMIIAMYHIGKKFGKSDNFVLVAIFLPLVWYIWLAIDKSTWQGKKPKIR